MLFALCWEQQLSIHSVSSQTKVEAAEDSVTLQHPGTGKMGSWVIAGLCALASCSGKSVVSLIPRASPAPVYIWPQLFLFMFALHYFFPLSATSLLILVCLGRERSNQHSFVTGMLF